MTALDTVGAGVFPLMTARAAATSDVLVPVTSAARVERLGETGLVFDGGGDFDFDLRSSSSDRLRALLIASSSSIAVSSSSTDVPTTGSLESLSACSSLTFIRELDSDCEAPLDSGLLSKNPGIGSPNVSAGLAAESRKRGSWPTRAR